jgi:catechol 2,3-dioxygenase-like lactoylglutathione lyase family enzyme
MSLDSSPAVETGYFHRLGFAAGPAEEFAPWFRRVLGARAVHTTMRQVHGLPMGSRDVSGASLESGARSEMLWLGRSPVCVFTATDMTGPLGHYVSRYGAGLHSVAWTVTDLWKAETLLRRRGLRITGVDVPGRHFFLHPADTSGLLIELSDTEFSEDPRDGANLAEAPAGVVEVSELAWLTVAVSDPRTAAEGLRELVTSEEVAGLPRPAGEESLDVRVSDVTIRFTRAEDRKGLVSFCLAVADLRVACAALADEGIGIIEHDGPLARTDRADTLGLDIQWVDADARR